MGAENSTTSQVKVTPGGRWMAVPDFYYKVLCDLKAGKSIAFVGHNRDDDGVFEMSVDQLVAHFTGLNLFPTKECNTGEAATDYFWAESGRPEKVFSSKSKKVSEEMVYV